MSSKAVDLLNNIATGVGTAGAGKHEEHIVVGADRLITVPDSLKKLAVQYDHGVETVTFDCPRYWDNHDLTAFTIYINGKRSDGAPFQCRCSKATVDENDSAIMHFDWLITNDVTSARGFLSFLVCIQEELIDINGRPVVDDNDNQLIGTHWNSELCNDCYISNGLEFDDVESSIDESILVSIRNDITRLKGLEPRLAALEDWYNTNIVKPLEIQYFVISDYVYNSEGKIVDVNFEWSFSTDEGIEAIAIVRGSSRLNIDKSSRACILNGPFDADTEFTIEVTDTKYNVLTASTSVRLGGVIYYGVGPKRDTAEDVDSTFVNDHLESMTAIKSGTILTVDMINNNYFYYCQPVSLGECGFTDPNEGYDAGVLKLGTTIISNVEYAIYRSQRTNFGPGIKYQITITKGVA